MWSGGATLHKYGIWTISDSLKSENSEFWNNLISRVRIKGFKTILNKSMTKWLKIKGNLGQIMEALVFNQGRINNLTC